MDIYGQLESMIQRRRYVESVLAAGNLEAWEAKEYSALECNYCLTIKELQQKIAKLPAAQHDRPH